MPKRQNNPKNEYIKQTVTALSISPFDVVAVITFAFLDYHPIEHCLRFRVTAD